ncbi:MAG: amino acid adenylation domain-containing protein [Lysobacteraceae bacterium]
MAVFRNAASDFMRSVQRFPERPALWLDGCTYRYRELGEHVVRLADALRKVDGTLCATLGERSLTAYCAPLACMLAGKIHVPLGASFPTARMANILSRTMPSALLCDRGSEIRLQALLAATAHPMCVLFPESTSLEAYPVPPSQHRYALTTPDADHQAQTCATDTAESHSCTQEQQPVAYLLFTSGSTGQPKGVAVGHAALCAYIDATLARYPEMDEHQRCSQFFEPTFDLAMHDLFVTWAAGACLYCIPKKELLLPVEFVNRHRLTVWFSVPSMLATLQRYRLLKPDCLPTLGLALFCGEALPGALVRQWLLAAPHARSENLYGPTEATIACTAHRIEAADTDGAVVAIGAPFPNMEIAVLNSDGSVCAGGETGELYLGGDQLAFGYWNDDTQTQQRFVEQDLPDKRSTRWYRTGDLAMLDATGVAHFRGRADRQIKLRGYRIELQEVESLLREACGTSEVAALPVPAGDGQPLSGIAAFVVAAEASKGALVAAMKANLPAYMVPSDIHCVSELPLNANGKTDYGQLAERLRNMPMAAPGRARPTPSEAPLRTGIDGKQSSPTPPTTA